MRFRCIPILPAFAALLLPIGAAAVAQTYEIHRIGPASAKGYDDVHLSKAAIAGQQVRIIVDIDVR